MAKISMVDKIKAGLSQEENRKKPALQELEDKIKKANEVFRSDEPVQHIPKPRTRKDTFTIPDDDYKLIQKNIDRAMQLMKRVNKSEVVRLGLAALDKITNDELLSLIERIERLKVGRPRAN